MEELFPPLTSMSVDPKLIDLGIDQRVVADKHVHLRQHVEVMFALSRYAINYKRKIIPKTMLTLFFDEKIN